MKNILIQPTPDIELVVTGSFIEGEVETGIRDSFSIFDVQLKSGELVEALQWANSLPSGSVLQVIEEKVLEKI